jgi:hypothetical protein
MVRQLIPKKMHIRSITRNAHRKYTVQATSKYPQRHNDSVTGESIGFLNQINKVVYVRIINGRLTKRANRNSGTMRLVKYGKGCLVRCA